MKPFVLNSIFLMFAIGGGGGIYFYQTQLVDVGSIRQDMSERLLKIENVDSRINELALRSRVNIDNNYDELVRASLTLGREVRDLERRYFNDAKMDGTLLERHFIKFKNAVVAKRDLIENFKSHNSVLRNSQRYAPVVGRKLMFVAENRDLTDVASFYREVVYGSMNYAVPAAQMESEDFLRELLQQIPVTEKQLPNEHVSQSMELANHIATVIAEKNQTDRYLNKIMSSNTTLHLTGLSKSVGGWLSGLENKQELFNKSVLGYIVLLLLFSGFTAFKVKRLHSRLNLETARA